MRKRYFWKRGVAFVMAVMLSTTSINANIYAAESSIVSDETTESEVVETPESEEVETTESEEVETIECEATEKNEVVTNEVALLSVEEETDIGAQTTALKDIVTLNNSLKLQSCTKSLGMIGRGRVLY